MESTNNNQRKRPRSLLYYYLIVCLVVIIFNAMIMPSFLSRQVQTVTYSEFINSVEKGRKRNGKSI